MSSSISDNGRYPEACMRAVQDEVIFASFKTLPDYMPILEHVDAAMGEQYFRVVSQSYPADQLAPYLGRASINDSLGGPIKYAYPFGTFSPTTLRYFKVAFDLHRLFGDLSNKTVCEIGGGYGGQYVVFQAMFGCRLWDIVDLPEACALQRKYIGRIGYQDFRACECTDLSVLLDSYDIVISNYAFSECSREFQDIYVERILRRSPRGYMTMNYCWGGSPETDRMISIAELQGVLPGIRVLEESPKSDPTNVLLVWP